MRIHELNCFALYDQVNLRVFGSQIEATLLVANNAIGDPQDVPVELLLLRDYFHGVHLT